MADGASAGLLRGVGARRGGQPIAAIAGAFLLVHLVVSVLGFGARTWAGGVVWLDPVTTAFAYLPPALLAYGDCFYRERRGRSPAVAKLSAALSLGTLVVLEAFAAAAPRADGSSTTGMAVVITPILGAAIGGLVYVVARVGAALVTRGIVAGTR